ncbi:MAG TPA: ferritin family protein [Usitatibacter sp.]|nr:ferritin family protein [Usitatibacter sp.]
MPRPIDTLELFYAHAIAIEREAVERYEEFTTYFRDRGDDVLAGLCENMAREEQEHHRKLLRAARGLELPPIDARRYRWLDEGSPEAPARELFYRVTTARQLLEIALAGELAARRFFRWVTRTSRDPAVRAAARTLSHEEADHARWVMDALQYREPTLDWEEMLASGVGPGVVSHG